MYHLAHGTSLELFRVHGRYHYLGGGVEEPEVDDERVEEVGPEAQPGERHPRPVRQHLLHETPLHSVGQESCRGSRKGKRQRLRSG